MTTASPPVTAAAPAATPPARSWPAPAIVLAAGRGERMRPLTDTTPKPLLPVRGQPLLAWHVQALVAGGCRHLVFNTAWLGEHISSFFESQRNSDGTFQLSIHGEKTPPFSAAFSREQADFGGALETAGGIARALPLLCPATLPHGAGHTADEQVFWVVAGDVFVPGFAFSQASVDRFRASTALAHLWLVPNPAHHPLGDFGLDANGLALNLPSTDPTTPRHTYSTMGLYRPALFGPPWCDLPAGNPAGTKAALGPLLRRAMDAGRVSAELYPGPWTDVGTPERLAELNR
jgi:MurNAc alpha-1-phosphate uridylyltransferase